MLHVDFSQFGEQKPDLVSVLTIHEAMSAIREHYPDAVPDTEWTPAATDPDDDWYLATLYVWSFGHATEGDPVAVIVNDSHDAPAD